MANCSSCGIQLPGSSSGKGDPLCADCRRRTAQSAAFSNPASPNPVSTNTGSTNPNFSKPSVITNGEVLPPNQAAPALPRASGFQFRWSVTTALVAINVAVYIAMVASGVSAVAPTPEQALKWGANFGPLTLTIQPWRLFTSNYVHFGIIHIFFNMWCLWNLGGLAERIFDRWTYIFVYTAAGIAGSLASLWWHPLGVGAGASGAIFGLAGALLAALYLGKLPIPKEAMRGTMKSLLMFAGYNLFFGLAGGIDNAAHIGGLLGGLGLGAFLASHLRDAPDVRQTWRNYAIVGTAVLMLLAFYYLRKMQPAAML